jgi:hypothetical protein
LEAQPVFILTIATATFACCITILPVKTAKDYQQNNQDDSHAKQAT